MPSRDDAPTPPVAVTPPPASAWSGEWTPPPVDAAPPGRGAPRRGVLPPLLAACAVLAIGLIVGAGVVTWHDRSADGASGVAEIAVDTSPARTAAGGAPVDAVGVARQLGPAVGTVVVKGPNGQSALGSGFVISHDANRSFLVTNRHVVDGATDVRVLMPGGKNLKGTVVGADALDDLAVVSVPDNSLKTAVFGKSADLQVGQRVIAIGSPLGNQGSVTSGVLSALHRTIQAGSSGGGASETLQDVLQTDASINPGNSGGPLADAEGRVVGVNVAVAGQGTNIGFSIPSDLARVVVDQLMRGKAVEHPFLGVSFVDELQATEQGKPYDGPGVLVEDVRSGTPAADAGLHAGDIITGMDGVTLDEGETVGGVLQRHRVGDAVPVTVRRGTQSLTLTVKLAARPSTLPG